MTLTPKQRRDKLVLSSSIDVTFSDDKAVPAWTYLSLSGPIARIPSLKNSRSIFSFKGKDGTPKVGFSKSVISEAWVQAATVLFQEAMLKAKRGAVQYDGKVSGFVIHGKRSNSFDVDNATSTLQDFLEPQEKLVGSAKNKKARGWGCGLVQDDSLVRLFPLRAEDFGLRGITNTIVILTSFENVAHEIYKLFSAHFCGSAPKVNEDSQRELWVPEIIMGGKS